MLIFNLLKYKNYLHKYNYEILFTIYHIKIS